MTDARPREVPDVEHRRVPDAEHHGASDAEHRGASDAEHRGAPDAQHHGAPDPEHRGAPDPEYREGPASIRDPDQGEEPVDLVPAAWLKFGQRNILYLGFVLLLVPLGMALDGKRQAGMQSAGGFGFALTLCLAVSVGFFLINSGIAVFNLAKRRSAAKALIGCALPLVFAVGSIVVRRMAM